jgi:hypothetical protein
MQKLETIVQIKIKISRTLWEKKTHARKKEKKEKSLLS